MLLASCRVGSDDEGIHVRNGKDIKLRAAVLYSTGLFVEGFYYPSRNGQEIIVAQLEKPASIYFVAF